MAELSYWHFEKCISSQSHFYDPSPPFHPNLQKAEMDVGGSSGSEESSVGSMSVMDLNPKEQVCVCDFDCQSMTQYPIFKCHISDTHSRSAPLCPDLTRKPDLNLMCGYVCARVYAPYVGNHHPPLHLGSTYVYITLPRHS